MAKLKSVSDLENQGLHPSTSYCRPWHRLCFMNSSLHFARRAEVQNRMRWGRGRAAVETEFLASSHGEVLGASLEGPAPIRPGRRRTCAWEQGRDRDGEAPSSSVRPGLGRGGSLRPHQGNRPNAERRLRRPPHRWRAVRRRGSPASTGGRHAAPSSLSGYTNLSPCRGGWRADHGRPEEAPDGARCGRVPIRRRCAGH